jgi:hypothetical protein
VPSTATLQHSFHEICHQAASFTPSQAARDKVLNLREEQGDKRLAGIFNRQANLFGKQTSLSVPLKPRRLWTAMLSSLFNSVSPASSLKPFSSAQDSAPRSNALSWPLPRNYEQAAR